MNTEQDAILSKTLWRSVWRDAIAPQMSSYVLAKLYQALKQGGEKLLQGVTCYPHGLFHNEVAEWPVEKACPVGFCGMVDGLKTVGEVQEFFARVCFDCDQRLGEPAGCRHFLNWWDDTPRMQAQAELAAEIEYNLKQRKEGKQSEEPNE